MQLTPCPSLGIAVLAHFPFAFPIDLQPCGIHHYMERFPLSPVAASPPPSPLADDTASCNQVCAAQDPSDRVTTPEGPVSLATASDTPPATSVCFEWLPPNTCVDSLAALCVPLHTRRRLPPRQTKTSNYSALSAPCYTRSSCGSGRLLSSSSTRHSLLLAYSITGDG